MKFWNKNWNIPGFLIFNIILFSCLFYFDLNRNINIGDFESIGTVSFKINSIQRKFDSAVVWHSISSNAPLKNRDTIKTYPESDAIIKLKDGTEIQVDENSMIFLDLQGNTPNINFEGGSIQINNSKSGKPNQEIVVKTKNQTLKLTGSDAKIDSSGKNINVSMEKGSATIEDSDGKSQKLNSNEIATLGESGVTTRKTPYILQEPENQKKIMSMNFPYPVSFRWNATGTNTNPTFELSRIKDFKRIETRLQNVTSANLNLTPGTYYWRVSGKNSKGEIETSESRKLILIKETGLQIYSPIEASTINYNSGNPNITLSWTPSESINEYFVELATNSAFTSNFKIIPVATNSIKLNNLTENTYYWRVVTKPSTEGITPIKSKTSSFTVSSKVETKTFELTSPADNAKLPLKASKNFVLFTWKSTNISKKFRIQISTKSDFKDLIVNEVTNEKIYNSAFTKEGIYFWRVAELQGESQGSFAPVRKFILSKEVEQTPEEKKIEQTKLEDTIKKEVDRNDSESISNLIPEKISPRSGKIDISKQKQIRFHWDKVKYASYYIVKIMDSGKKANTLITEKTTETFFILRNFSKLSEGNFQWDVTPFDKKNKSGKTAKGKFTIDLDDDPLKNLKPEEIKILSPETIYRDK